MRTRQILKETILITGSIFAPASLLLRNYYNFFNNLKYCRDASPPPPPFFLDTGIPLREICCLMYNTHFNYYSNIFKDNASFFMHFTILCLVIYTRAYIGLYLSPFWKVLLVTITVFIWFTATLNTVRMLLCHYSQPSLIYF